MDSKILTENGWKAIAAKSKIKDNGLQKALAAYEQAGDDDYEAQLKAVASINQCATALKKVREVAAIPAVVKYLADLTGAAASAEGDITKAKAAADKAAAVAQKKAAADTKKEDEGEDEDEDEDGGDYGAKLLAAFQKLKGAKDVTYEFLICDAKPIGLMVAKKITAQHRAQLTQLTDSKRFLPLGTCSFQDGKFAFTLEKPVAGLARRIQDSIKNFTGKKLPVAVGKESAEADDEGPEASGAGAAPQPVAPPKLGKAELAKAPNVWHSTRDILDKNIEAYKKAVLKAAAGEPPDLMKQINQNLAKLDGIMDNLDTELAESLTKAYAAKNDAARKAELKKSKAILGDYIKFVKTEPLIAHVDDNPFGVKTNLKKVLVDSLTHMAQAIG